MSNFRLVIGNAGPREKSSVIDRLLRVRPRLYATPKTEEYDLVMPSTSPIARLRRWRNRELSGPRMRMGLWLELFAFCDCEPRMEIGGVRPSTFLHDLSCDSIPRLRQGIRIDLRLTANPVPRRCRLVLVNDQSAQFWSYSNDKTSFVSIQLPEYVVHPATSNYVGIVEWQWDGPFDLDRGGRAEPIEIGEHRDSGLFRITDNSDFTLEHKLYSMQSGMTEASSEKCKMRVA